jgi:hypothetical protein
MARTLEQIVHEYVNYVEEQNELANEPSRPLEGEELKRVLAEWDKKFKEMYPNGINAAEVEQAADRWRRPRTSPRGSSNSWPRSTRRTPRSNSYGRTKTVWKPNSGTTRSGTSTWGTS